MIRELGKGAMGVVYLGRDPVIGRLVALKTIRAVSEDDVEEREFRERFLREAQAAGILSHPNIVTVHDVGEDSATETSFIAMEYVEGKNLKQLLSERTPFTFERIAEIIGQVAEALDYAHRRGIVHRDVKPANIIITPENQVKITDFGIAKTEKSNLTTTGQFLGTPNYMSPEQVTGDGVDGRSDLFSLGVVLYELLTRKKPFTAENLTSISYKIVHEQFVPPETYDASVPPEFAGVLDRALAKDPSARFQRGNDFALALYEFKAREEERQMLRDLGQMVAEAEKLGSVAAVTAPPSPPPPAAPAPSAGRSPFDILAAAPPAAPVSRREPPAYDDLATREVSRSTPSTEPGPHADPLPGVAGEGLPPGGSDSWKLEEPTRSKKSPPPPPPAPEPAGDDQDVDASLPGPEVVERSAKRLDGLAVSPLDEFPRGPDASGDRPEGATEIIQVGGFPGFSPAPAAGAGTGEGVAVPETPQVPETPDVPAGPERTAPASAVPFGQFPDRPTEILRAIPPPAVETPEISEKPAPVVPFEPFLDRPTEILRAIPPPAVETPEISERPAPVVPFEPFLDRPTEILRAVPPPAVQTPDILETPAPAAPFEPYLDRPTEILSAIAAPAAVPPVTVPAPAAPAVPAQAGPERPTEILRSPFPPGGHQAVPPPSGVAGPREEPATERITNAMKLARAGGPSPAPAPPPPVPPLARPKAHSAASPERPPASGDRTPAPPPSSPLPPAGLEPVRETPPGKEEPVPPLMKRAVNGKFVVLIIGLALAAAAVVAGVLWTKKARIDAQAVVDEVREREIQELKGLMEDGNRLLAAGSAAQALEKFREVIRRKPDSVAAREAAARAEEQARSTQADQERVREVDARLAAAREAAEVGEFDRALDELSAVLLLEPENADALSVRDSIRAAQAEKAAADKKAAAALAKKKKPTPVPTPIRVAVPVVPAEAPKVATPTPASARIRITFRSPAPEGYVMVRRNDKEIFRRQFDFGRKSAGGLVEGTVEIPSGPANIKAWAIPTDRSFNGYEAVDLVIPGGGTSTLVLELNAAGKLAVSLR